MLYLLPSPLGNLCDITLHSLEILRKGEVFLCEDTRMSEKLLSLLEERGWIEANKRKFYAFHSHNQEMFLSKIKPSFFDSVVIFMSDAGMPCVSDPGSMLVSYAQRFGLDYEVLPGGSAPNLAYAYSGFGDGGFVFDAFLPHKSSLRKERLSYWREVLGDLPLITFESPQRLLSSLEDLASLDGDCEVFAIKEMTKKFQRSFRGKASEIVPRLEKEDLRGEWVLVLRFSPSLSEQKLGSAEILNLDIPPKIKAKLLSKLSGIPPKQWYQRLMEKE